MKLDITEKIMRSKSLTGSRKIMKNQQHLLSSFNNCHYQLKNYRSAPIQGTIIYKHECEMTKLTNANPYTNSKEKEKKRNT